MKYIDKKWFIPITMYKLYIKENSLFCVHIS